MPTDPSKYTSSRKKESLATIQQLSPVWLRVVCELWPWNVEPLKADRNQLKFGHKLQERWKDTGLLWLDQIYSEPIMLDVATIGPTLPPLGAYNGVSEAIIRLLTRLHSLTLHV